MPIENSVSEQEIKKAVDFSILQKEVEDLQKEVKSLQHDRDSALRWGLVVLGTSVISMATWIFKLITAKIPSL